jgi:hypothetical protein
MKLRIHKNSLRIRLRKPEMTRLHESGSLRVSLSIPPNLNRPLAYTLTDSPDPLGVMFDGAEIKISVSRAGFLQLHETDLVGLEHLCAIPGHESINLMLEKDFEVCTIPPEKISRMLFPTRNEQL